MQFRSSCASSFRAADGTRTHHLVLGKHAFYRMNYGRNDVSKDCESAWFIFKMITLLLQLTSRSRRESNPR